MPKLTRKLGARRFLFFDTEANSKEIAPYKKELTFRLGHAVYVEYSKSYKVKEVRSYDFETAHDFVPIVDKHATGSGVLYCVAHNIAFDMQVLDLPRLLHEAGYRLELPSLSFTTTLWRVHKKKRSIHFMDSANIFPGKLSDLAQDVGLPKYDIDPFSPDDELVWRRCRRDVMILVRLFDHYLKWLHTERLGYFGETLAWQAFNAYRTRFYEGNISVHEDYVVLGYERLAYHGARTECFYIGRAPEQDYYLLDVNSMYGFVMAKETYPVSLEDIHIRPSQKQLRDLLSDYYVIAQVELETDEAAYPFRTNTKLVFPTGQFHAHLHHAELVHALQREHIKSVSYALLYHHSSLFGRYVDYFYSLKAAAQTQGDKLTERLAKLFLNSLSGRFGQRAFNTYLLGKAEHEGIRHYVCKVAGTNYVFDQWDYYGRVFSSIRAGEKPYSSPAIAGAITAYGRMCLWGLIRKAGIENVFYVDTDSILVNGQGYQNLDSEVSEHSIGKLKIVSASTELAIFAPKDYRLGIQAKRKGVRSQSNGWLADKGETELFERMNTAMKRGHHGSVQVTEVHKERRSTYDKGRIEADGRVTPWVLPNDLGQPVFSKR